MTCEMDVIVILFQDQTPLTLKNDMDDFKSPAAPVSAQVSLQDFMYGTHVLLLK